MGYVKPMFTLVRAYCECGNACEEDILDAIKRVFGQDFTGEIVRFEADEPIFASVSIGIERGLVMDFRVNAEHAEKLVEILEPKIEELERIIAENTDGQDVQVETFEIYLRRSGINIL